MCNIKKFLSHSEHITVKKVHINVESEFRAQMFTSFETGFYHRLDGALLLHLGLDGGLPSIK